MLLVPVVVGIAVLTWVNNANYVIAGNKVAKAIDHYYSGDLQTSLDLLNQSVELAPAVSLYHNYKSGVYSAFLERDSGPQEYGCKLQKDLVYPVCPAYPRPPHGRPEDSSIYNQCAARLAATVPSFFVCYI